MTRVVEGSRSGARLALAALVGTGLGAGLMYLLDPDAGRGPRARAGQRLRDLVLDTGHAADDRSRRAMTRARGLVVELGSRLSAGPVSDEALARRVRARIRRVVREPGAVAVEAAGGVITLAGTVAQDEVDRLLARAAGVRGVRGVANRLEVTPATEARSS